MAHRSAGWSPIQGAFWRKGGIAPGFRHEEVLPRLTAEAVGVVEGHDLGRPLFLYLALPAPHTPWLPGTEYRGRSRAGMYGDFVSQVDSSVGAVLAALRRRGMERDTLVVFTSDNGPVWYPADRQRLGHDAVGGLRGMRSDAWEGGHRMPFLLRWPARVRAGAVSDRLLCFTDLLATFAAVAGVAPPLNCGEDSVSFLPTLEGRPQPPRGPTVLKANASVLRHGRYKLINHLGSGGFSKPRRVASRPGGAQGQLYDLQLDPGEQRNLWLACPDLVRRMQEQLLRLSRRDP